MNNRLLMFGTLPLAAAALAASNSSGSTSAPDISELGDRLAALELTVETRATTDRSDEIDGLVSRINELSDRLHESDGRVLKAENDLAAIRDQPHDANVVAAAMGEAETTDFLAGFNTATPSFPNGFIAYVLQTNFRSELVNYRKEIDALPATIQPDELA